MNLMTLDPHCGLFCGATLIDELRTHYKNPFALTVPSEIYAAYSVTLDYVDEHPYVERMTVDFTTPTFKVNDTNYSWLEELCYSIFKQLCKLNVLLTVLQLIKWYYTYSASRVSSNNFYIIILLDK